MLAYSAKKKKTNITTTTTTTITTTTTTTTTACSVIKPLTSYDSASARSKGALFVSPTDPKISHPLLLKNQKALFHL